LKNNLRTLLAKARASGIKFFVATQKATSDSIDTTLRENLQSKILMRTISKDAQRVVIPREQIEELGVEPSRFSKGRFVLFGEKILDLVQSPFIKEDFYEEISKLRTDLVKNENDLKQVEVKNDLVKNEDDLKQVEVVENDVLSKNKDVEEKRDEFLCKNNFEVNDNLSPNNNLEEAVKKRKELYKNARNLEVENKKEVMKMLRDIKKRQEEQNLDCLKDLEEIEKKFFLN
jgi:hypothetical protein